MTVARSAPRLGRFGGIRRLLRRLGLVALGAGVALAAWGILIEPRLVVWDEQPAALPNLPAAWDGATIGLIADLQVGIPFANTDTARRAVAGLVERRPAAVLIGGDLVYESAPNPDPEIEKVVDILRPLPTAGIPTYAVLGNHDYAAETGATSGGDLVAGRLAGALESVGIRVLRNDAARLPAPDDGRPSAGALYLAGVGPHRPNADRPAVALDGIPPGAARIVLMHNPETFRELPPGSAPLAFAGHTHGGQVRAPFFPEISRMGLRTPDDYPIDGWSDPGFGEPGNRLYVNQGIGFSLLPLRLFCPPEVTLIQLRAA